MGLKKFSAMLQEDADLMDNMKSKSQTEEKKSDFMPVPVEEEEKALGIDKEEAKKVPAEKEEVPTKEVQKISKEEKQVKAQKKEKSDQMNIQSNNSIKKSVSVNSRTKGRRTNAEKGLETRKQYSITLKESTYEAAYAKAIEEDIPFAKLMERAALEYIKNHQ